MIFNEAFVVATARTPIAKLFRGSFNRTRPDDLLAECLNGLLGKVANLPTELIEEVAIGCAATERPQAYNIARIAIARAGFPMECAASTVNRFCASGMQAVATAAQLIATNGVDAAIGGGVESVSTTIQFHEPDRNAWLEANRPEIYIALGITAENIAKRFSISREDQDACAMLSQQRTARAQVQGKFADEIVPIKAKQGIIDHETQEVVETRDVIADRDECNRPSTTLQKLTRLAPCFDTESGMGSVTAGNSSPLADGASTTLLMSSRLTEELSIQPLVAFRGWAVTGCPPELMGIGPVTAIERLLKRQGLGINDIGLWELNESFASQVIYCQRRLGIDPDIMNVNGGAISLGHPFGMTGSRLVGTLALEMQRRQVRYGVVATCVGGGQGCAMLFERC